MSRLQAKTLQIGQMLNNLQRFNHLLNDDNANNRNMDNKASFSRSNKNPQIKIKPNTLVFQEIPKWSGNSVKRSPKSLETENIEQEKRNCAKDEPQPSDVTDSVSSENNQSKEPTPKDDEQVVTETSQNIDSDKTES